MKRFFMLSVLALAAAAAVNFLPGSALAAGEFVRLSVTGTNVNLRPQPRASGAALAQANPEDAFIAEKVTFTAADGSRWYKILFTLDPSGNFRSAAGDPRFKGSPPYISAQFVSAAPLSSDDEKRAASSGSAFALEVRVRNDFDTKMTVAIVYCEAKAQNWRTIGWYSVEPHSEKKLNFQALKTDVYIYAQLAGLSMTWGNGDITRTVTGNAFSYYDGEECPAGNNRRDVKFTKYTAKNGIVDFRPESSAPDSPLAAVGDAPAKASGGGASPLDKYEIMKKWVGDGMSAEIMGSQVRLRKDGVGDDLTMYDYEWDDDKTEFQLTKYPGRPLAVMKFVQGEKLVLKIEGTYPNKNATDGGEDELIPFSASMLRLQDADVKLYPSYDVFDWSGSERPAESGITVTKEEMANAIIAVWKKYDEQVDAKFLNAKNLVKAIDGYRGDWNQALIFDIACELAGVDIDSYEGMEDY
jgi:uncharacterized membrane protein